MTTLEKKKPELRAVNRAGQSLIRQLENPEKLEKELDELSDKYYCVTDFTKSRLKATKEAVAKVRVFIEIMEVIEIWIEEVITIVKGFESAGTEPETLKKQLEEIEVR